MPVLLFFGDILCFSGAGRREPREAKYNMSMKVYQAGIDIGSTTVKLVVTDADGHTLFSDYRRHCARTQETLADLLRDVRGQLGSCCLRVGMTGSGALSLADALHVTFEQEVVAVAEALEAAAPGTDVAIELGGEDAKII